MNRLIDAFQDFFTMATGAGRELAKTASFILKNVDWTAKLSKPEPVSHAVVDTQLDMACANSGKNGSDSHPLAQTLLAVWLWTSHLDSEVLIIRD